MHMITDSYPIGQYVVTTEFDSGAELGGELTAWIECEGETLIQRTFYFGADKRRIHAFARKFVSDPAYQRSCLAGTVRWARVNAWFFRNNIAYCPQLMPIQTAATPKQLSAMRAQNDRAETYFRRLYALIDQQIEQWETTPAYQKHIRIEQTLQEPSITMLDPAIEAVILAFNQMPGVVTRFSCQGLRRGISIEAWEYGPIWFPGKHEPLAYVHFSDLPADMAQHLDAYVRAAKVGVIKQGRVRAQVPEQNSAFIQALEEFRALHYRKAVDVIPAHSAKGEPNEQYRSSARPRRGVRPRPGRPQRV